MQLVQSGRIDVVVGSHRHERGFAHHSCNHAVKGGRSSLLATEKLASAVPSTSAAIAYLEGEDFEHAPNAPKWAGSLTEAIARHLRKHRSRRYGELKNNGLLLTASPGVTGNEDNEVSLGRWPTEEYKVARMRCGGRSAYPCMAGFDSWLRKNVDGR